MEIRKASMNDLAALTSLMEQLGYPTTVENMKTRFETINAHPDYRTLVADDEGNVVGMIGFVKGHYYESDGCYVRIVALVVDARFRRKGIGEKLMEEAEKCARAWGAVGIALNSGNRRERTAAHHFYKKMGYVERSVGFGKSLK